MKKILLTILCFLFILPTLANAENSSTEEVFKKSFPRQNFESITPTQIKGIYEVYTGGQIYYFMPDAEVIITGEIISKDGINITRQSTLKKMAPKMADLPLESALKIGQGKITVLEFTDPNCPYCRLAAIYFSKRKDITVYVFFKPLSQDSERKIRHILCSKDKVKSYEDVMAGKLDNNASLNICNDAKVEETIRIHQQLASQVGIRAAPSFFIKGEAVEGFEKNNIENLLNK